MQQSKLKTCIYIKQHVQIFKRYCCMTRVRNITRDNTANTMCKLNTHNNIMIFINMHITKNIN